VDSMISRWDAEWSACSGGDVADLAGHENWPWVAKAIPAPGRVLEAGCGFARWVAFLDSQGYEAYGLDYSPVAIERSLAVWPQLRLSQGDFRSMPYEDGFFDGIVSFGAIEHDINGPDAALAEMYRVLRPGGTVYCTVPCMNFARRLGWMAVQDWLVRNPLIRRLAGRRPDDAEFFEYVFRPAEYRDALQKAGFQVLDLVPLGPYSLEAKGACRRAIIRAIHKRWPWCLCHMVGAICRKPSADLKATPPLPEEHA